MATLLGAIAEMAPYHHANETAADQDYATTRFKTRDAWAEWPPYRCFLSDSTRGKIAEIYATDLARYAQYF
jgi:hypothetical protein